MFGTGRIFHRLVRVLQRAIQPSKAKEATAGPPARGEEKAAPYPKRVWADFNGLFRGGEILCLSHTATSVDENGDTVELHRGMRLTAFMEDADDEGNRDDLIAAGTVELPPEWLSCRGSKWILVIDEDGVRHESELQNDNVEPSD